MKNFLSTLHRWLGFPLGLLFVVIFATGAIFAVEELLKRADQATVNSNYSYQSTTLAENAQALATITDGKKDIRSIVLPNPNTPYYRVVGRGESWTYAINQLEDVTHAQDSESSFFSDSLQLHRNFLLGREGLWGVEGKHYAAWVSLLALAISLLGLWLWWPLRKTFKTKDIVPRGRKRKHFYYNHMTGGVVLLIAILVLTVSGVSITYRAVTQQLMGIQQDKVEDKQTVSIENNWLAWLETAYAQMPADAQLQQIRFPRQPRQPVEIPADSKSTVPEQKPELILTFQFHAAGNWLGLAGSTVSIDKQNSVLVDTSLFSELPLAEKVFAMFKPLHTGRALPALYVGLLLILSILGTIMVFSGLVSFVIKKRKRIKAERLVSTTPVTES